MRKIRLFRGEYALVDEEDYAELSKFHWHADWRGRIVYVSRDQERPRGKYAIVRMHRQVMRARHGQVVDHVNCNGLDNRKENLRFATHSQNHANSPKRKNTVSQFKGAKRMRDHWTAEIGVNGIRLYLGHYSTEEEAAVAYMFGAILYHGEFARA